MPRRPLDRINAVIVQCSTELMAYGLAQQQKNRENNSVSTLFIRNYTLHMLICKNDIFQYVTVGH